MTMPVVPKLGRGDTDLKNRLRLQNPGQPLPFDTDRDFIEEVQSRTDLKGTIEQARGKDEKSAEEVFTRFGQESMKLVVELHEKYKDRTAEMVDIVARQTGMAFPHKLQLLLEEFLLCTRPADRWGIAEGTHRAIKFQVYGCSVLQALRDGGDLQGLPCRCIEHVGFKQAADFLKMEVTIEQSKTLPQDRVCEFVVRPGA